MNPYALVIAVLMGALLPLQALINAALGKQTAGPVFAALASFSVGTLVLLGGWWLSRPNVDLTMLGRAPWWAWAGGVIGAFYVAGTTLLIPRLGAAALICMVVLGQLLGSLLLAISAYCMRGNRLTAAGCWARCWCWRARCW